MREKEFNPNLVQFGTVFMRKTDRSFLGLEDQGLFEDEPKHVVIKTTSSEDIITLGIINPDEPEDKWKITCIAGSAEVGYITRVIGQLTIAQIIAGAKRFANTEGFNLPDNFVEMITDYQKQSKILDFSD